MKGSVVLSPQIRTLQVTKVLALPQISHSDRTIDQKYEHLRPRSPRQFQAIYRVRVLTRSSNAIFGTFPIVLVLFRG